jgi:hypothetical protein
VWELPAIAITPSPASAVPMTSDTGDSAAGTV